MRIRLILSLILISMISIVTVILVAQQGTANEVRAFLYRGGINDSVGLVDQLEEFYQSHGAWLGVENLILQQTPGRGMGKGGNINPGAGYFILADANHNIIMNTLDGDDRKNLNVFERGSAIRLFVGDSVVGYLIAEGGQGDNRQQGSQLISRLNNAAFIAALIAGVLSIIIAWFLANRIMKPVTELTQAAKQLGMGDLSGRVQVHGSDELAVLGDSFNQMADSLQKAEDSRRAMTSDIAHELRNPLAVQRANLEALQDGIYPMTAENIAPVIEQNKLLTRLVDDLRTLALVDAGRLELDLVRVNLLDLIRRIMDLHKPGAKDRGVSLKLDEIEPQVFKNYEIVADPMRLEQILGNLIDNALRFTPEGREVTVYIMSAIDHLTIRVHDGGPGIPESALPFIFDRFYRADPSRSRKNGGTGLGLAISRQLAEAHGGKIEAENHPDGGAEFSLILPREGETHRTVL
jgi:two-component system sensor histidine kinase BaeS